MNELQSQTDQLLKALAQLETTVHQDLLLLLAGVAVLIIISAIGVLRR
jgi:hypothetical protein